MQEIDLRNRLKVNNSEQGKKTDVKKIGLHERLQSFPNEHLCISCLCLFKQLFVLKELRTVKTT